MGPLEASNLCTSGAQEDINKVAGATLYALAKTLFRQTAGVWKEWAEIGKRIGVSVRKCSVWDYNRFRQNKTEAAKIYEPTSPPMDHKGS